ncbi:MAG: Holliday junction branch migration protein RuvA [Endomicrobium sp.]|jgi:Holliday junction DNA helicase RuvA|nr:Holliday junction branch migration protein RuvA [Endomicrobium sp.]
MIDYIAGTLESAELDNIVVETGGIGYKIFIAPFSFGQLPARNSFVKIYIIEAVAGMYGGVINLYGFLTKEEREMFLLIKDEVPGTGAKKALEYTDKVSKSFADFKTAVAGKNSAMLTGVFGFTKKTADKLIAALKDKISSLNVTGGQKWADASQTSSAGIVLEAVSALVALGYKEIQSRNAVNEIYLENSEIKLENLIKKSLNIYKD